jgi:hypothetical protein
MLDEGHTLTSNLLENQSRAGFACSAGQKVHSSSRNSHRATVSPGALYECVEYCLSRLWLASYWLQSVCHGC